MPASDSSECKGDGTDVNDFGDKAKEWTPGESEWASACWCPEVSGGARRCLGGGISVLGDS